MLALPAATQQLVTMLLREEVFSTTALDHILEQHRLVGGRLADFLLDTGLITESELLGLYAKAGYKLANLSMLEDIDASVVRQLSGSLAQLHKSIPFRQVANRLSVAFLEPPEMSVLSSMKGLAGRDIEVFLAPREVVQWAIAKHYPELLLKPSDKESLKDPLENRIGQRLIQSGLLTNAQLNEALLERTPGKAGRTGELLLRMGYVTEEDLYKTLAHQNQLEFMLLPQGFQIPGEVVALFSKSEALQFQAVPIDANATSITFLTSEPVRQPEVQNLFERRLQWKLSTPGQLKRLMFQLETEFDPLCNLLVQQGLLRLEQRAQAHIRARAGEPLNLVLLELGITPYQLTQAQESLPTEQVIPVVRPWGNVIDLFEDPMLESGTDNSLEGLLRRIVREELERFKAELMRDLP